MIWGASRSSIRCALPLACSGSLAISLLCFGTPAHTSCSIFRRAEPQICARLSVRISTSEDSWASQPSHRTTTCSQGSPQVQYDTKSAFQHLGRHCCTRNRDHLVLLLLGTLVKRPSPKHQAGLSSRILSGASCPARRTHNLLGAELNPTKT